MPEVVVAKPAADGTPREWNDVFPIWNIEEDNDPEWKIINEILYAIAMNNRFGNKTAKQEENYLRKSVRENTGKYLDEVLAKYEASEKTSEDREALLKERASIMRQAGTWDYYLTNVFANLQGAYREYK